jgi:NitT/TauT family transport system permease protein
MVLIILLLVMLEEASLYYIVGVVVLPIIYEATINGLNSIDPYVIDEVKMISNTNFTIVKKIYLPLTSPFILTSLLQSIGLGLKVLIMAEFISNTNNSVGYQMILYMNSYKDMSYVYAWGIILVCFIIVVDLVINKIYTKKSLV